MGRAAPRYLFRDRITVFTELVEGGDIREYPESSGQKFRCRFEPGVRLRSSEGRNRQVGYATVWVPRRQHLRRRRNRRVRRIHSTAFAVGSRVGQGAEPQVSDSLFMPFDLERDRDLIVDVTTDHFAFLPEMQVRYERTGGLYQIVEVEEFHGPRGPDHWRIILRDQRG